MIDSIDHGPREENDAELFGFSLRVISNTTIATLVERSSQHDGDILRNTSEIHAEIAFIFENGSFKFTHIVKLPFYVDDNSEEAQSTAPYSRKRKELVLAPEQTVAIFQKIDPQIRRAFFRYYARSKAETIFRKEHGGFPVYSEDYHQREVERIWEGMRWSYVSFLRKFEQSLLENNQ